MPLKDSAPEKWEYKEHTRVKHELLKKYLYAWIIKLGKFHRKICYFDGFAGRGEYTDGTFGSPIIAIQVANQLLEQCEIKGHPMYFDEFVCINIEKDLDNFNNLETVIEQEKEKLKYKDKIKIININNEFAPIISEVLKKVGANIAPSFFFIDPFGWSGLPFDIIKEILSLRRTEIFLTFMTRDINRFLQTEKFEEVLHELYGVTDWKSLYNIPDWQKRDQALKDLYIQCLRENAKVKFTFAFRLCMDEKYQTLYYLIYATNNFDGLFIMKSIMYNQGSSGTFAYLGPNEVTYRSQYMLFAEDIPSFKKYLLKRFAGRSITYRKIEEESYMDTRSFIDKHYREALKKMENEGYIKISRIPSLTRTGRIRKGLGKDDIITFS